MLIKLAADAWRLIRESSAHVILSGLGKITQAFDRVVAEQAGSADAWKPVKQQPLIDAGRWSELTGDQADNRRYLSRCG